MLLTQFNFVFQNETTSVCKNIHGTLSEEDSGQSMSRTQQDPVQLPMNSGINRKNPLRNSVGWIYLTDGKRAMILVPKMSLLSQASVFSLVLDFYL